MSSSGLEFVPIWGWSRLWVPETQRSGEGNLGHPYEDRSSPDLWSNLGEKKMRHAERVDTQFGWLMLPTGGHRGSRHWAHTRFLRSASGVHTTPPRTPTRGQRDESPRVALSAPSVVHGRARFLLRCSA